MRRSARVILVLAGAVSLPSCGGDPEPAAASRDRYASLQDCLDDWVRPENCEPDLPRYGGTGIGMGPGARFGGGSMGYVGPVYSDQSRDILQSQVRSSARAAGYAVEPAAPPANHAAEHFSVSRGGFGSTARSFAGVGE